MSEEVKAQEQEPKETATVSGEQGEKPKGGQPAEGEADGKSYTQKDLEAAIKVARAEAVKQAKKEAAEEAERQRMEQQGEYKELNEKLTNELQAARDEIKKRERREAVGEAADQAESEFTPAAIKKLAIKLDDGEKEPEEVIKDVIDLLRDASKGTAKPMGDEGNQSPMSRQHGGGNRQQLLIELYKKGRNGDRQAQRRADMMITEMKKNGEKLPSLVGLA